MEKNKTNGDSFISSQSDDNPQNMNLEERHEIFPWEHVDSCIDDVIEPIPNGLPCPICGKPSESLHWIRFCSPKWTWENLMGCMGPMSICMDCHCQVEFECYFLN